MGLGQAWGMLGIGLGYAWDRLGISLGQPWDKLGIGLRQALDRLGIGLGLAWDRLGIGIGQAQHKFGIGLGKAQGGVDLNMIGKQNSKQPKPNLNLAFPELDLKVANLVLHIHVKNENDPWCGKSQISQLLLDQNSKSRTVLKFSEPADFQTDLTF